MPGKRSFSEVDSGDVRLKGGPAKRPCTERRLIENAVAIYGSLESRYSEFFDIVSAFARGNGDLGLQRAASFETLAGRYPCMSQLLEDHDFTGLVRRMRNTSFSTEVRNALRKHREEKFSL